jgi:hypothetical protein
VRFVAAGDQDQVLGGQGSAASWLRIGGDLEGLLAGLLPGGLEVGRDGWGLFEQALAELFLGLGQGGQGIDAQEQDAGFVVGNRNGIACRIPFLTQHRNGAVATQRDGSTISSCSSRTSV